MHSPICCGSLAWLMNLLARIKPAQALLMRVHYEIVQQIINRLSKYLSALKICIFHSFLFLHPASHMQLYVCVCVCAIHFNISTEPEMTL